MGLQYRGSILVSILGSSVPEKALLSQLKKPLLANIRITSYPLMVG